MKILGREPALWLSLVAATVQLVSSYFYELSPGQQGAVNAAAAAAMGLLTAWAVSSEKAVPAVLGLVQALLSAALAFGVQLPADDQSVVMAFVAAVLGMFTRQVVTAPVPETARARHALDD